VGFPRLQARVDVKSGDQFGDSPQTNASALSAEVMAVLAAGVGLAGSFVYAALFAPIAIALGYLTIRKRTPKRWPTWVGWATIAVSTLNFVAWIFIFTSSAP